MSGPADCVLQVKISLLGASKPPVWRRLLVPADIRLDRLHKHDAGGDGLGGLPHARVLGRLLRIRAGGS